jgi:hypothetical protein
MDPREFLECATRLSASNRPADLRTATSRAYYAAFNVAVGLLDKLVPLSKGPAAHGQVQKLLANCGEPALVQAGGEVGSLHSRRIDSDYYMSDTRCENQKTVQAAVARVKMLIETMDRAFAASDAQALKKTIQQYWTQTLREPLRGRESAQ